MKSWYASKRPADRIVEAAPHATEESEILPPRKDNRLTTLPRAAAPVVSGEITNSQGEPIKEQERSHLETAFGHDLGDVRVHRDDDAGQLAANADANAFTAGRDIYFAAGAYGPATLAHEVSHVLQQAQASSFLPAEDASLERQADTASSAVMSGHAAEVSGAVSAPALQRQPAPGMQSSSLRLLPTDSTTLDSFDVDKFELSGSNKQKLDEFAKRLKSTLSSAPDSIVMIVGYADSPGTEPHNLALGQKRTEAVRDYLVSKGVPAGQLHPTSLGESLPVVASKGYEAKNRRVEINVVERSLFKPPAPASPVAPAPAPAAPTLPKPLDLKYKPESHEPTPSQELQERMRQIDRAVREAEAAEKANPGTSAADAAGHVLRNAAKKLGLPRWVQDQAESLGKDLPSKGAQAAIGQIAADTNMDANTQNALKALIDALMRTKIK